jgi:hypothetical protein
LFANDGDAFSPQGMQHSHGSTSETLQQHVVAEAKKSLEDEFDFDNFKTH